VYIKLHIVKSSQDCPVTHQLSATNPVYTPAYAVAVVSVYIAHVM